MKHLLNLFIIALLITSCRKNAKKDENGTFINCLETTVIRTNIPEYFLSVYFLNAKNGFITGSLGGIYKTTDSAKTWTPLTSTTSLPVRDIFFLDSLKGFAVGGVDTCNGTGCIIAGGFILETLDGGETWVKIFTPSDKIEISSIYFLNKTIGFCAGDNVIFKTIDGGRSWSEYKINHPGGRMMEISFTDAQNGYVVCMFGKILRTTNGGSTWEITSPDGNTGFYSLSAAGGSIYVAGQDKIIKSVDGGNSWAPLANSPADIFAIHFADENNGFAFGRGNWSGGDFGYSYGSIFCTNDGGHTWNGNGDIKEAGIISSVSFPSNKIGYAVSENRIIRLFIK